MNADGSDVSDVSVLGLGDHPDWQPLLPGPQRGDYKNSAQFCKAERELWAMSSRSLRERQQRLREVRQPERLGHHGGQPVSYRGDHRFGIFPQAVVARNLKDHSPVRGRRHAERVSDTCTTSIGTATASSSGRRLGAADAPDRRGG